MGIAERQSAPPVEPDEEERKATMARKRILVSIAALAVAGCVAKQEAPPPAPEPAPAAELAPEPTPPAPAADWRDIALTPGDWRFDPARRVAEFGAPGAPLFSLRCDMAAKQIVLTRSGTARGNTLIVRTSFGFRSLPLETVAGSPQLAARVPASDRVLDGMVFSRGRFTVQMPGTALLVIPAFAEPARVIEDCRA